MTPAEITIRHARSETRRVGSVRIIDLLTDERIHGWDVASRFNRLHSRTAAKFGRTRFRDHPFDESCGRRLAELVDYLGAVGPDMEVFGEVHLRELWLYDEGAQGIVRMIKVLIDWPDYAPLKDGEPNLHFRVEIHVECKLIGETRAGTLAEAEEAIRQSFGP